MLAHVHRIPLLIAMLLAADLMLALAPVLDYVIGRPFQRLSNLFDLRNEGTLPTWLTRPRRHPPSRYNSKSIHTMSRRRIPLSSMTAG